MTLGRLYIRCNCKEEFKRARRQKRDGCQKAACATLYTRVADSGIDGKEWGRQDDTALKQDESGNDRGDDGW